MNTHTREPHGLLSSSAAHQYASMMSGGEQVKLALRAAAVCCCKRGATARLSKDTGGKAKVKSGGPGGPRLECNCLRS
jgi:hypothetical protein